jgi:hypothetical protein
VQCLFRKLTFICHVQIEKLVAGVGHAGDSTMPFSKLAL